MSEGTNPRPPIANRSFVLSDSARRATARLSEPPRVELDRVRRNIESQYPGREVESTNVVIEREFPFNNVDESLLVTESTDSTNEIRREERRPRPRISRTPSNVSLRREFSSSRIRVAKHCRRRGPGRTAAGRAQIRAANDGYRPYTTSTETRRNGPHRDIRTITGNAHRDAYGIALVT